MRRLYIFGFLFFTSAFLFGTHAPLIKFKENKNQWPAAVHFMGEFYNGKVFLEKDAFVFQVVNYEQLKTADQLQRKNGNLHSELSGHVYTSRFIGAQTQNIVAEELEPEYYNFFLGKDQSRWSTHVQAYKKISYQELYPGINMEAYSEGGNFKYDLLVSPHADAGLIRIKVEDADAVLLVDKALHIETNAGTIIEKAPVVYQLIHNQKKIIPCEYVLDNGSITFSFPKGYNTNYALVIDPVVIACTFTGSTAYCNGEGSDSDDQGNAYLVGSCSSPSFPVTSGAFQTTLGGMMDVTFHKFNTNGTALLFATYLGGSGEEKSYCVNVNKNEAAILGYTSSCNFPVSASGYDTSCNGGYDMFIAKLDTTGAVLIGSTYVGGSGNDGPPGAWQPGQLRNYELVMDTSRNVFVVTATTSSDFPVSPGAYSTSFSGGTFDGAVFKLNAALSNMLWSTYLGGSGEDCVHALRLDGQGGVYCLGTTGSTNFPVTGAAVSATHSGGTFDCFATHLDANGSNVLASTFIGTSGIDFGYLLTLDQNNNVYLYCIMYTAGAFTTTPNAYNIPTGKNLIYKLDPGLSQFLVKSRFGTSTFNSYGYLAAAAFDVDSCGNIYIAGDAGPGLPATPNALKSSTNNFDLYYCVFSKNATALLYGSYFGGPYSEWATFGVCRMDKRGVMYYSFNGNNGTPVTPGAYAASNMPHDTHDVLFDHGLFKVDLQTFLTATAYSSDLQDGCVPYQMSFTNQSPTSNVQWVFGDGSSPVFGVDSVSHTYAAVGNYNLLLIATDTSTCNEVDTLVVPVRVLTNPQANLPDSLAFCPDKGATLDAGNPGFSYSWSTGEHSQSIYASQPGLYTVTISNPGCSITDNSVLFVSAASHLPVFPNIITPNGDGVNDKFDPSVFYADEFSLNIFDRWGKLVFSSASAPGVWDGTSNGKTTDGTYFFTLKYKTACIKDWQEAKGFITVVK